ncbi:MAG: hypothetical protein NUV93_03605, partial [Firmicutes bacterium]|nr:hypothetical protein [Bacillota bacterium]
CFPIRALPDVSKLAAGAAGAAASGLARVCPRPGSLAVRGLGDVCMGDRKILGSSFYLKRRVGLYQASLIVLDFRDEVSRYLRHPSREPDYRAGRPHSEFITSLEQEGGPTDFRLLGDIFRESYREWMREFMV